MKKEEALFERVRLSGLFSTSLIRHKEKCQQAGYLHQSIRLLLLAPGPSCMRWVETRKERGGIRGERKVEDIRGRGEKIKGRTVEKRGGTENVPLK